MADPPDPLLEERGTSHETHLVERARLGDEQAFRHLMERYGPMVLALAYASTLDHGDAEDLAQETFLAAWRTLPQFRGDATFATWLYRLGRSRCIDRARRAAVRPAGPQRHLTDPPAGSDPPTASARAVLAAAAALPLEQRQAVLMRDVQGLSYDEIAAVQEVPIGTVRSRIANGRRAIADAVREEVGG